MTSSVFITFSIRPKLYFSASLFYQKYADSLQILLIPCLMYYLNILLLLEKFYPKKSAIVWPSKWHPPCFWLYDSRSKLRFSSKDSYNWSNMAPYNLWVVQSHNTVPKTVYGVQLYLCMSSISEKYLLDATLWSYYRTMLVVDWGCRWEYVRNMISYRGIPFCFFLPSVSFLTYSTLRSLKHIKSRYVS